MTGPKPSDLAEITWENGIESETEIAQRGVYGWSIFGSGAAVVDEWVTAVRPLSVVPTDSLEALLTAAERTGLLSDSISREVYTAAAIVREALA